MRCSTSQCGKHKAAASSLYQVQYVATCLHYLSMQLQLAALSTMDSSTIEWASTCISDLDHVDCHKSSPPAQQELFVHRCHMTIITSILKVL